MKYFILLSLMITVAIAGYSQAITYRTAQSGNFSAPATWVAGAPGMPPAAPTDCNCKIVISAGHTLTLDANLTLINARIVLDGPSTVLTFANNVDLILNTAGGGTSSIDIQDPAARIQRGNPQNNITLGGQVIYDGGTTQIPGGAGVGVVQGPASASSARANPNFISAVLPVKLSEFKVSEKSNGVALSWKTDLEINSSHFDIQRSTDNKNWTSIGTVSAAGSVNVEQNYSFIDAAPEQGANYYRIRIVDIDSKVGYSLIKSITFSLTTLTLATNPNPASNTLYVIVNQPGKEPYKLRLINRSGQVVYDQKHPASDKRVQLNVSNYAEGSYFLEATNSSGLKQVNKVVIVRSR